MSSREQFEAWAKAEGLINDPLGIRWVNEEFLNACWKAWQASRQAIEIALPVLEQQESTTDTHWQIENDGWIEWHGDCGPYHKPVDGCVEVKFKGGGKNRGSSSIWSWKHNDCDSDIIAYRQIENDGREG
jgi:hypothetical protein